MDDHFRFPPPLPFEVSPTLNQMKSQENPWEISPMPSSFPHPLNNHLPLRGQSFYFKTRMCVRFKSGRCPNGDSCNFAHSSEELRRPLINGAANRACLPHEDHCYSSYRQNPNMPNCYVWVNNQSEESKLYKNKVCRKFYIGGVCPYGDKCSFLHVDPGSLQDTSGDHNESSYRQNPLLWKTKLCHRWSTSGKCPYGDHCNHAHGDAELRKVGLDDCEGDGNKSIAAAPSKVSPSLSDDVLQKVKPQPISLRQPHSRIKTLTLEKCKRIYGDWIDD